MSHTACPCCGQSIPIGQKELTKDEIRRLPMGNQHTKWNVIKWQVVKAAAHYYEVSDWTSIADSSLTHGENVALMAQNGTNFEATGGKTMREMESEF
jgi:hypothetical protein